MNVPLRADEIAGPGRQALESDAVALGLLLDAFGLEIVDDDGREILSSQIRIGGRAPALGGVDVVDQFFLARRQHAMRRQAFDRERPGDTHASVIDVGLVVEIFDIGTGGDRGVDLLLAGDASFPPLTVNPDCLAIRPGIKGPIR